MDKDTPEPIQPLFFTVDPGRDTAAAVKKYCAGTLLLPWPATREEGKGRDCRVLAKAAGLRG